MSERKNRPDSLANGITPTEASQYLEQDIGLPREQWDMALNDAEVAHEIKAYIKIAEGTERRQVGEVVRNLRESEGLIGSRSEYLRKLYTGEH